MPPIAVLVALADPTRCRIVEILREGPQPVHVVAGAFKISRPAISRHLRVLKQAKLISEKKAGRENRYALHAEKLKPVAEWLAEMREAALAPAKPAKTQSKPAAPKAKAIQPSAAPAPVVQPKPPAPEPWVATPKPSAAKAKREVPPAPETSLSQMGFDF